MIKISSLQSMLCFYVISRVGKKLKMIQDFGKGSRSSSIFPFIASQFYFQTQIFSVEVPTVQSSETGRESLFSTFSWWKKIWVVFLRAGLEGASLLHLELHFNETPGDDSGDAGSQHSGSFKRLAFLILFFSFWVLGNAEHSSWRV